MNANLELFRRALSDAAELEIRKTEEEIKDIEVPPPSKRHKIRMNRVFRERVGGSFLPFPEADNFYERVRSKLVIKLKINEFLDRRKKRRLNEKVISLKEKYEKHRKVSRIFLFHALCTFILDS